MERSSVARSFSAGAVILAAGRSARMGRPKLLLPWGSTSVLGHLVSQWRSLRVEQVAVVCAAGDGAIQIELDRIGFPGSDRIINPAPERGMFSSIQSAAQWRGWKAGLTHWAIALGDQPHLRRQTLATVIEFSAAHPELVCQPMSRGRPRHPVLLPRPAFQQLVNSSAADLKAFLASLSPGPAFCELADAGLDLDIDRPEDYEKALERWSGGVTE